MKNTIASLLFSILILTSCKQERIKLQLDIDAAVTAGEIDLTRYSLGQGGLSPQPMIDSHNEQIKNLHPKTIRFFVQEYFNLYPARGKYNWEILDKTLDAIVATGARPIPDICFKPALLYPELDQNIVHPLSYEEWDELIYQLVKHCKEKNYGIQYWEIGNEIDLGEPGGCPYLFKPEDFTVYYKHTAEAILRADSAAKVGGGAFSNISLPQMDSLISFCAAGKAPLDFISYHIYNNSIDFYRGIIRCVRDEKLGKYPSLKNTETMITEWNMSIFNPNLNPYFQPAFILEITKLFYDEKLSAAAYYHIRDVYIDTLVFNKILSRKNVELFADMFNTMPYFGIFDNQGRVRPVYFAFLCLSQQKGLKLDVMGTNEDVKSFTTKSGNWIYSIFWNFPSGENAKKYECTVNYKSVKEGNYKIFRINAESAVNNIEILHFGPVSELEKTPIKITLDPYEIRWIEFTP